MDSRNSALHFAHQRTKGVVMATIKFQPYRCEGVRPSQDCCSALYSTWNRVGEAKVCVCISVTIALSAMYMSCPPPNVGP